MFIVGIYFYATRNDLHDVSSFNFNRFCPHQQTTTDLGAGFFINDDTGNVLYFTRGALIVITTLLCETLRPHGTCDWRDLAILVGTAGPYASAIVAYAACDPVLVGLVYAAGIAVVAAVLWVRVRAHDRAHPVTTYTAVAYSLGTLAALASRLR